MRLSSFNLFFYVGKQNYACQVIDTKYLFILFVIAKHDNEIYVAHGCNECLSWLHTLEVVVFAGERAETARGEREAPPLTAASGAQTQTRSRRVSGIIARLPAAEAALDKLLETISHCMKKRLSSPQTDTDPAQIRLALTPHVARICVQSDHQRNTKPVRTEES